MLGGRKAGIGYGSKSPVDNIAVRNNPSPNDYNIRGMSAKKGIGLYNKPVGIVKYDNIEY